MASERLLGRLFGLRDSISNIAYVLAFVSAGALFALLGVRIVFALGGAGLLTVTVVSCLGFRPHRSGEALPALAEAA